MRVLTDTERLDALNDLGLCLAQNLHVTIAGTEESWVCTWGLNKCVIAASSRDAIDLAVACIEAEEQSSHFH